MSSWGNNRVFSNKIMILLILMTSLNLLHNILQPILSFQAVIHISTGISIFRAFVVVAGAVVMTVNLVYIITY
jgi:hypothetical protein